MSRLHLTFTIAGPAEGGVMNTSTFHDDLLCGDTESVPGTRPSWVQRFCCRLGVEVGCRLGGLGGWRMIWIKIISCEGCK